MDSARKSFKDLITKKKKKRPNPEGVEIHISVHHKPILDRRPRIETSETDVVIAIPDTRAGSDGGVGTGMSEGTSQATQDSQAESQAMLDTGVKHEEVLPVASAGLPLAGRTGSSVKEAGVGNNVVPKTQDVMNFIVMKYLSQFENYEDFAREIERVHKVLIVKAEPGCVIFTALCSSLEILDALWFDYCTGNLNDMAQKYLVTKDVLKKFGLTELKLTTTIQVEEYIAARKLFLRGSEGKTKGGKEKGQAAEKPPCSSKDKDQPQRDEVSKGTDSGTVLCGSTEEELKSEKEVCAATCTAVEGDTSVSENNKELNQLHSVEKEGDVTEMKSTLPRGFTVDSRNTTGRTPLMNAALNGNFRVVKRMIKRGADPSLTDNKGWNTLHHAAQGGDTDIISLIHTHLPNIESKTGQGYTPLMVAAFKGKLHAVKWFLEKGAAIACEDKKGWSPLHHAAKGGDPGTIDLILTHLPDVDSKTADGETPLIIAVSYGKLQGVKYLLERGANPLAKDNKGQDSLYHASSCDSDCFDLLLNHVPRSESTTGND